ncbi:breast cancer anti-estrogen resistance protein 3 isoform X2 [Nerophis ophidion]|uniref:breast cancer anti-estrogen resistance protein 3 isoform X2 n=1 Tax=Nerophis ophidion TaxID=159077 RepID=UPI002AE03725|nr:breast cancer anti-estrogen resistance protein 3 isoform X2 [Nerophis ophidion]
MMAEGRFASLPRSLHMHHTLGGTAAPAPALEAPIGSSCPSRKLQASIACSMDLLSSRPSLPPGLGSEFPAAAYQHISIHGTLPRRKRGGPNLGPATYTWDPRASHTQQVLGGSSTLAETRVHQHIPSPLVQNIIDDFHSYGEPAAGLEATVDYVKFSQDQFILDGPSEKLRRELEEELKMNCEEPRSHAWYHGAIPRQVAENFVQRDGDFLVRDSLSSPGSYVLTCQWRNTAQHFKINKKIVMLNEAYSRVEYRLEREGFDSVPALIRYYVGNRKPVSQVVGAIIFQPINRALPLRCLEQKYGLSSGHREAGLSDQDRRRQKRLSLNITNGHAHDHAHGVQDGTHYHNNCMGRGSQLRLKDRCGSQPASLNQLQDKRRPLKAHQSESFLPLGSKPQHQHPSDPLLQSLNAKSPVFRTGSEPLLSPSVTRRLAESLAGQPIRGSDSQLCPKPPPKPSKVPLTRLPRFPCLQLPGPSTTVTDPSSTTLDSSCVDTHVSSWRLGDPVKHTHPDSGFSSCAVPPIPYPDFERLPPAPADLRPCSPLEWNNPTSSDNAHELEQLPCSYVERLRQEGEVGGTVGEGEPAGGRRGMDRSSYHHAIAALENTSDEEEEEGGDEGGEKRSLFLRPVLETESAFRPTEFNSRLLPAENKPLEMLVLKRAKELLLSHNHHSIARHLLMVDCQVARILGVSPELKGQMGVSSGLELVTLPHGRQLRLDLMERHHTMAIGVAVDILGCTGSVEERASTLNRIILVALELKDAVGDLFAFTALMKALELPQISRLEDTWTTLRRNFTETAISYEKTLKPFYKNLYEGTGFQCDEDLLEVFKTDFQLRLLWGSRGASVNQSDRYSKFSLILTALSRKLEPRHKTQTLI